MRFENLNISLKPVSGNDITLQNLSLDSRKVQAGDFFLCLVGEKYDAHEFIPEVLLKKPAGIIVCKPIPDSDNTQVIHVEDTLQFLQKLAYEKAKSLNAIRIAVTGTNGKTSTKEFLRFLFQHAVENPSSVHATEKNLNNFYGVPYTILSANQNTKVLICEAGMNRKGEIAVLSKIIQPHFAIITSIAEGHIGNFHSFQEIIEEKFSITKSLQGNLIIPPALQSYAKDLFPAAIVVDNAFFQNQIQFNTIQDHKKQGTELIYKGKRYLLPILGKHQMQNFLLALATVKLASEQYDFIRWNPEQLFLGMREFQPPAGRMIKKEMEKQITLWDDSYNANLNSFRAAIETLLAITNKTESLAAILGEMLELGKQSKAMHEELGRIVRAAHFKPVLFEGSQEAREAFAKGYGNQHLFLVDIEEKDRESIFKAWKQELTLPAHVLLKASRGIKIESWLPFFNNEA
ncbi:MAG: UDP-N-acetylmuramoyl-tripeptide--D-alanyl-D-alanine ligase [Candidatus Hydrogenedentota bacterium]|nr:MAG: UDP-N-acetylmuramoyl-tripeptide--D-alanyl-D-alanine ligase [Candidatus Hydrogenedentota bacterium]